MSKKFAFLLLLSGAVSASYASAVHSATIDLSDEVHAGATSIPPGHYTLHWEADSGNADLTLLGSKKKQYTVPVTIGSGPAAGGTQVLTRQDGTVTTLEGFKVKDLVLTVR